MKLAVCLSVFFCAILLSPVQAIPDVYTCGVLNQPGETYVLQNDIYSNGSCLIITKNDITLDLNGHTVTYGMGPEVPVTNAGFEDDLDIWDGLTGWDISNAPSTEIITGRDWQGEVGFGTHSLQFTAPHNTEYVLSDEITIPAGRTYVLSGQIKVFDDMTNASAYITLTNYPACTIAWSKKGPGGAFNVCRIKTAVPLTTRIMLRVNGSGLVTHDYDFFFDEVRILPAFDHGIMQCAYPNANGIYPDVTDCSGNNGATNLEVKNGEVVQGAYSHMQYPIYMQNPGNNIVVQNLTLRTQGTNAKGIFIQGGQGNRVLDNTIYNAGRIIINRNQFDGLAIYMYSIDSDLRISGNKIIGSPQAGIRVDKCGPCSGNNVIIENNDISYSARYSNPFAILPYVSNAIVRNNTIILDSGRGVHVTEFNTSVYNNYIDTRESANSEYHELVVGGNIENAGSAVQIEGYTVDSANIFNNTLITHSYPERYADGMAIRISKNVSNIRIFNNDVYAYSSSPDRGAYGFSALSNRKGPLLVYNNTFHTQSGLTYIKDSIDTLFANNTFEKMDEGNWFTSVILLDSKDESYNNRNHTFLDNELMGGMDISDSAFDFLVDWQKVSDYNVQYTITIEVLDGSNQPMSGATIRIQDTNLNTVYSGTTNSGGKIATPLRQFIHDYTGVHSQTTHYVTVNSTSYDKIVLITVDSKKTVTITPNTPSCTDIDGDGYYINTCGGTDCNDADASIHPFAQEYCSDNIDQDCSGVDLACLDCGDLVAPLEGCNCQGTILTEGLYCTAWMGDHIWLQQGFSGYYGTVDPEIRIGDLLNTNPWKQMIRHGSVGAKDLLWFNLSEIEQGRKIQNATLHLYSERDFAQTSTTIRLYEILKPWNHAEVTWNCTTDLDHNGCSSPESWENPGIEGNTDRNPAYQEQTVNLYTWSYWNVTEKAMDWITLGEPNYGFLLEEQLGRYWRFAEAHDVEWPHNGYSYAPILEIWLEPESIIVPVQCGTYDINSDGIINQTELSPAMQDWYHGQVGMNDLILNLRSWLDGTCHLP
ncbi:MAG: DNRLRE domain-containing protein [Candidatus Woesearchaeota archaeon]